jgi:hypothetical protein
MNEKNGRNQPKKMNIFGFSLLQTSVMLMMAALVLISLIPGQQAGDTNQKIIDTIARLNKVEDGMQRFMALRGRRPCPADGIYDVNEANFGLEAGAVTANSPLGSCKGGTPVASMGPDGTGYIVAGMIPTKTLALPDDYAFDAWGRRMAYYVDIRATASASCYATKTGSLQVRTKDPTGAVVHTDNVMYAYVSRGPGGYGAWPAQGSTLASRINNGSADSDKQANAGVNVLSPFTGVLSNFTNILVRKDRTSNFDDVVYYLENYKNTCCLGAACTNAGGFEGEGENANDNNGTRVISLDLNGDGLSDTATCAPNASPGGLAAAGSVYVVFGVKGSIYGQPIAFSTINGTNGTRINGAAAGAHICSSLAAGDVNGDNIHDLIIGAGDAAGTQGEAYVIQGGIGAWPASCSVSGLLGLNAGTNCQNGFMFRGVTAGDKLGFSVAVRDFNGDDYDDVLAGAPGAGASDGKAYLVCGAPSGFAGSFLVSALNGIPNAAGTCGFAVNATASSVEKLGHAVTMGNINGDVYSDVIIGAPDGNTGVRMRTGRVYDICGGSGTYPASINVSGLTGTPGSPGTCGAVFTGVGSNHHAGTSVDVGDVNGDGTMDLLIGAPNANALGRNNGGSTYVVYGKDTGFAATFDLNSVNQSTSGFRIDGLAGDNAGTSVHGRCDINGDGIQDILVGAPKASPLARASAGGIYVVFGAATALSTIDVNILDGISGVKIHGAVAGDETGSDVGSGDFYNFGLCNVIAGAPKREVGVNANAGSVFTIMGRQEWNSTYDINTLR